MKIYFLIGVIFSALLVSCKTSNNTLSDIKAAVDHPSKNSSTIGSRLEMLKQGFKSDFKSVDVCVGEGQGDYTSSHFLLEIKLAYAMWIGASEYYTEEDWNNLKFISANDCLTNELYSASANIAPKDNFTSLYPLVPFEIICHRPPGLSYSCEGKNTITRGYAGSGWVKTWSQSDLPGKWVRVGLGNVAGLILNSNLKLESIAENISRHTKLSQEVKTEIVSLYNKLLLPDQQTMANLQALGHLLDQNKVISEPDYVFNDLVEEFKNSTNQTLEKPYFAATGVFKVILHEVGHQFGLQHADDPMTDEINIDATGQVLPAGTVYKTEDSTMAYADDFLYTTADDRNGVKYLAKETQKFLAEKLIPKVVIPPSSQFAFYNVKNEQKLTANFSFAFHGIPQNASYVSMYWGSGVQPFDSIKLEAGQTEVLSESRWTLSGRGTVKAVAVTANGAVLERIEVKVLGVDQ